MVTRGKSATDLAYAAGIVDGEGSISIRRVRPRGAGKSPRHEATVDVGNVNFALLEWLRDTFGGSVYEQRPSQSHYQRVRRWNVAARQAAAFCQDILPYLKIKQRQAALIVQFVEERSDYRGGPYKGPRKPLPDDELAFRDGMWQRMKALNARPQRLSEMAPQPDGVGEAIV